MRLYLFSVFAEGWGVFREATCVCTVVFLGGVRGGERSSARWVLGFSIDLLVG